MKRCSIQMKSCSIQQTYANNLADEEPRDHIVTAVILQLMS